MEKVGRNDTCPCGSGRKFKRCCAERVEQEQRSARQAAEDGRVGQEVAERRRAENAAAEFREVDQRAEAVLDLIKAGRLDEAESAARQFTVELPDETTAVERLGQVYEAQGQPQAAADEYRRGVAMMDARGDGHFCDCCRARMVKAIGRLDPDGPAPALGRDPQ
jgi:predicted Zn-dependent protease